MAVGDMADKAAVSDALKGVGKAVLIMSNGEDQLTTEKQFTDCAVAAGVKHLVKLSSMESNPGTTKPIPAMHVASEDHIRASRMNWTMIRPAFFTQNFLGAARTIKAGDEIILALGNAVVCARPIRSNSFWGAHQPRSSSLSRIMSGSIRDNGVTADAAGDCPGTLHTPYTYA